MELGRQLLFSAKYGDTDSVRDLMCRGAPFTTDWVCIFVINFYNQLHNNSIIIILFDS